MAKLADFLPKLYLPLLALLCLAFAWQPLKGVDDFWAHAAIGRWMAQHGRVPDQTLFLWGPSTPINWIYHSWLSQLTFFKMLDWGGTLERGAVFALLLTYAVAVTILIWLWLIWARRARPTALTAFLFIIALWCSSPRLHPRPELFSGLFLCPLLTFLLVWTERREEGRLPSHLALRIFGLAALFVLWANFHGGVASGLVFIVLTIFGELIQDVLERRDKKPTLILCGVLLACAVAINFNPYGLSYWSALRPVVGPMFAQINEWKPVWKTPAMGLDAIMVTTLLAILALSAWAGRPRPRVAHLLWLLFATFAYVMARRQIQQFAQVSLVVMAANAAALDTQRFWRTWRPHGPQHEPQHGPQHGPDEIPLRVRLVARIATVTLLICAMWSAVPGDFPPLRSLSPQLPVRAAQFIQDRCPNARLFSDYSSSSYLDWHLAGTPPLYIDLLNAYPDRLLGDYFDIIYLKPRGLKMLDDLPISHIFIKKPADDKISGFAAFMQKNPRWTPIYRGNDGTIWVRRGEVSRPLKSRPVSVGRNVAPSPTPTGAVARERN